MASTPFQTAMSFLSTVASHYPGLQNSVPTTTGSPPSALATIAKAFAPSAPMNIPGVTPSSNVMPGSLPSSNPGSSTCDYCHLRPKYVDGSKTHPFCSKSCASKASGQNSNAVSSGDCDFCHSRPKYFDGTRTHDYCSKACAKQNTNRAPQRTGSTSVKKVKNPPGTCQAPGCKNAGHVSSGTILDYCSVTHKKIVENICLMCNQAEKQSKSHFCGALCSDAAEKAGPAILEVPPGHVTFNSVADQFKASWRHTGTSCPTVRRVYKILSTPTSLADYDAYRAAVEARGQFVATGRSAGNENRRWHGTHRQCNLGDKGHTRFCSSGTCSLCCIVRSSFDLSLFGKKTGWGRFGKGIYTSSTSSKSNDYSHNDCISELKAILLNKVVVGKGYKMTQDSTSLSSPPTGYDSVLAEVGGSLNYDELVVYRNEAIRPSFLVMYDA